MGVCLKNGNVENIKDINTRSKLLDTQPYLKLLVF